MTISVWAALSLAMSVSALVYVLTTTRRIARERDRMTEKAYFYTSEYLKMRKERDAALYDMHQLQGAICAYCANLYRPDGADHVACRVFGKDYGGEDGSPLICGSFKWRGICAENMKEAKNDVLPTQTEP